MILDEIKDFRFNFIIFRFNLKISFSATYLLAYWGRITHDVIGYQVLQMFLVSFSASLLRNFLWLNFLLAFGSIRP